MKRLANIITILVLALAPLAACHAAEVNAPAKTVWACAKCDFKQNEAGECPTCADPLMQYDLVYDCQTCGMEQINPGTCSMCGTPLREKRLRS